MTEFISVFWDNHHTGIMISFVISIFITYMYHTMISEKKEIKAELRFIRALLASIRELLASKGMFDPKL